MISQTEENYLKAIFKIIERADKAASTNMIASAMHTTAGSVTAMIKNLAEKKWVTYEKYRGVVLTKEGAGIATMLIRKHRIWEVFLCKTLSYSWDECHELAEQLEHIQNTGLIDRLDKLLGKPQFDPHGDPIPDSEGRFPPRRQKILSTLTVGQQGTVTSVLDNSPRFLQHLDRIGVKLGIKIKVLEIFDFDGSFKLRLNGKVELTVTGKVAENIYVEI